MIADCLISTCFGLLQYLRATVKEGKEETEPACFRLLWKDLCKEQQKENFLMLGCIQDFLALHSCHREGGH